MHRRARPVAILTLVLTFLAACSMPAPTSLPATATPVPPVVPTAQAAHSMPTAPPPTATAPPPPPTAPPPTTAPTPTAQTTGLRVVYFREGHVTLWTEGRGDNAPATIRPLAKGNAERVRISDDGQVIAYLGSDESGAGGLFAVDADGAGPRLLLGQDYLAGLEPAATMIGDFGFAPATHTLYAVTDRYDLQRVDAGGGLPADVLAAGQGGFFSFSPDGRWVTLYHPNELALARADGTQVRVVVAYPEEYRFTMMGPEIVWSPDSTGFYTVAATGPLGASENMAVWYVPVTGDALKQMAYTGPYGSHLSPDGRRVLYASYQHEPIDVHVVDADGQDALYGAYASKAYPGFRVMGWAPDSTRFVLDLSADARMPAPHLSALGQAPVKLTDTEFAYPLAWVDAERILFISSGPSGGELRLQRLGAPSVVLDTVSGGEFAFVDLKP